MGDIKFIAAKAGDFTGNESGKSLVESMRCYCRSIELCDDYLRGYYGLKLVGFESR
jgi:hypothetical protein